MKAQPFTEEIVGETGALTPENIEECIKALRVQTAGQKTVDLILPFPKWVLSDRYKGRGRPRKSDYDWIDLVRLVDVINEIL